MSEHSTGFERELGALARRLKVQRNARGLSQTEAAQRMTDTGVSTTQSTVARLENGVRWPTGEELYALAAVYGVPAGSLLTAPDTDKDAALIDVGLELHTAQEALQAAQEATNRAAQSLQASFRGQ